MRWRSRSLRHVEGAPLGPKAAKSGAGRPTAPGLVLLGNQQPEQHSQLAEVCRHLQLQRQRHGFLPYCLSNRLLCR